MKVHNVSGIDLVPTSREKVTFRLAPICIDSNYLHSNSSSYLWITIPPAKMTFPYFTKKETENGERST